VKRVTDPALLAQLEGEEPPAPGGLKRVTDPALIAQLEGAEEPRSVPKEVVRQGGLTVRNAARGMYALPGIVANVPAILANQALGLYEKVAGKEKGFRFPDQTGFADYLADRTGLPQAENATERVVGDVTAGMAGAGSMVKAGTDLATKASSRVVQRIGDVLRTAPGAQVTAGATGPGASSVVREEGGGTGAQLAAGVVGSLIPAAPTGVAEGVRRFLRGGEQGRQRVAANIDTFERSGAGSPTVGQATEARSGRAIESVLAKVPGSAGRMVRKAEAESAGLGAKVGEIATNLSPRAGAEPAGRAIRGGMEDFVEGFKARAAKLYDKVDRYIPPDTTVSATNTLAKLKELTKPIEGAKQTSKLIQTPRLSSVESALAADAAATPAQPILSRLLGADGKPIVTGETLAQPGGIPYQALKELRSAIGAKLSNPSLVDDVPTGQWKQLYGALTKDMGAAARAAGPKAEQAMVKASNYYRGRMDTIEKVLQPILKKADPEDVFKAAISGTNEGATTIRGVVKSIPPESRKMLAATVLRRLGKATAGKQDELGEVFSTETFLTNWNRIAPEAKKSLFSTLSREHRADLDKIAKVASNIRDGSRVFANPSGTAQGVASQTPLFILLGTGSAGAALGQPIASNMAARLMESPKFVRWLAESTRKPVEQWPAQLNALFQQSLYLNGEDRKDVRAYISAVRQATRQAPAAEPSSTAPQGVGR
jgi:hypothetical protein